MYFSGGIAGLIILALLIYSVLDVISTDDALIRNLPKLVWLVLIFFVPVIGPVAWLLLGRPERAGFKPGDTAYRGSRPLGPEDSPQFLAGLDPERDRLQRWEDDLARREEELRRREQGDP